MMKPPHHPSPRQPKQQSVKRPPSPSVQQQHQHAVTTSNSLNQTPSSSMSRSSPHRTGGVAASLQENDTPNKMMMNNDSYYHQQQYQTSSAIPAAIASLKQPLPATRFSSSIARDLMEKFPTEDSARSQLLYTQLQVDALTEMNAKMQHEIAVLKKLQEKLPMATGSSQDEISSATTMKSSLVKLEDKIDLVIQNLNMTDDGTPQSARGWKHSSSSSAANTATNSSTSFLLESLLSKVNSTLLPLASRQSQRIIDLEQQLLEEKTRNNNNHSLEEMNSLRRECDERRKRESEAVKKNEELERQIHYLKQFQIALCGAQQQQGVPVGSESSGEIGFSLASIVDDSKKKGNNTRKRNNAAAALNDSTDDL